MCLQCHAPPLLAMTLVGLLLRNVNTLGDQVHVDPPNVTLSLTPSHGGNH